MKTLLFLFCALGLFAFMGPKSTVYQWRGELRSGVYNESNLLKNWPAEGPSLLWSTEEIGDGYTSPTITSDALYISGAIDSLGYLFKFDLKGKLLWKTNYDKEWIVNYPGSRCNPTLVDNLIYIGSGKGNLFCLSAEDGKIIWSKKFTDDFKGVYPMFGFSEAPLVDDNLVFWTPGGEHYNVVALDRVSGNIVWSNECFKERSAYNNPTIIDLSSRKILVTFTAYHMLGLDTKTGKLLWSYEETNIPAEKRDLGQGDTHANNILYENGIIYHVEGDGDAAIKFKLSEDGTSISKIWSNKSFDSYMGGFIKVADKMYCGANQKPRLVGINTNTGVLTDSLNIGSGSIIFADNMLYYYSLKGQVHLLDCSENSIKPVSAFKVLKGSNEHFAHPVINKGILYIRHGKALIAYDIAKK